MKNKEAYSAIAQLFCYPDEGYSQKIEDCNAILKTDYPDAALLFQRFYDYAEGKSDVEWEEIFNITFHIQAICFLDLGYVLFGEDYKRGEFLVHMKKEQEKINHHCKGELYDNLPHVLFLMTESQDQEFVAELAVKVVRTALIKMLEEFQSARMELRAKIMKRKQKVILMENFKTLQAVEGNIYQNALQALLSVIETDFNFSSKNQVKTVPSLGNFLHQCGTC